MLDSADTDLRVRQVESIGQLPRVWMAISFVSLAMGLALTFDPSFTDARSTVFTLLPFLLLPTLAVLFTQLPSRGPSTELTVAAVASVAAWTLLVLDDERWAVLTFALYGLAFSLERMSGLALAGVVTIVWVIAWIVSDVPAWRLAIPFGAFIAGVVVWITLFRAGERNIELASLVEELRATRDELATAEREKGILEERARVAGEIHDTLAQGFTSIVVLSRAARRSGDWEHNVEQIESVASDNLQAARRLVDAIGPAELESASLPDAMQRQVDELIGDRAAVHFDVIGVPRRLVGEVDIALLRCLQEALRNVRAHADATEVHVTLTYLDDLVVLDVSDDGNGFVLGTTTERGDLTGGQGLQALRRRAEALGGRLDVESARGHGAVVSIQIPTEAS